MKMSKKFDKVFDISVEKPGGPDVLIVHPDVFKDLMLMVEQEPPKKVIEHLRQAFDDWGKEEEE